MAQLTREQILARKLGREVVELPDESGSVTVRGISRDEAIEMQEIEGTAARDTFVIATCLVEPKMSIEDVEAWAASDDAGTLKTVSEAIATLSRMTPAAQKEITKSPARRRK